MSNSNAMHYISHEWISQILILNKKFKHLLKLKANVFATTYI